MATGRIITSLPRMRQAPIAYAHSTGKSTTKRQRVWRERIGGTQRSFARRSLGGARGGDARRLL